MTILVRHGTTPTGFGIRQRRNGALRAISKCCGRSMERKPGGRGAVCKGCAKDYIHDENKLGCVLGNDLPLVAKDWKHTEPAYSIWVRTVTGDKYATLSVSFPVV